MQIVVDGILTHYEQVGKGKEYCLVLPGWGRSGKEWLPTVAGLAEPYTTLVLDLPGFGGTAAPPAGCDIFAYAHFVEQFLQKLGIKKCALVGHSFGGRIGIVLAAKTDLVSQLVLVDSGGIEVKSTLTQVRAGLARLLKPLLPAALRQLLAERFGSADYRQAGALRATFVKVVNQDLQALLPAIKIPTTIVWGETDPVLPLKSVRIFKQAIPQATVRIVWEAGHDPHLEKPAEFQEILGEALC